MLELRILTGLHRGAALPLEGDTIRIGSSERNDIVLLDPGMPAVATVICRSESHGWEYRSYRSGDPGGDGFETASVANGTALAAGTRWFAGPVLIGCEEECAPWPATAPQSGPRGRDRSRKRSAPFQTKLGLALATVAILTALAALTVPWVRNPFHAGSLAAATLSARPGADAIAPGKTPIRTVKALLYPSDAAPRPPFRIRSASAGHYGFVVTDDGQTLVPGSRWHAFTLDHVEPRRAVFTGAHTAELAW